jgi:NADPH2:quinone reductase
VAFTRFGGYAQYVTAPALAVVSLPENIGNGEGTALATQYCTAYHAAVDMAHIRENELVLIHAAAGGVGIALTQLAHMVGATVIGTAGSQEKIAFLKASGVEYAVNYREKDFDKEVPRITGGRLPDVIFDPVGGKNFSKSRKILDYGGRIVTYGASSQLTLGKGPLAPFRLLLGFGFLHPVGLIVNSKGVLGVNMLKIADHKPEILQKAMQEVVRLASAGKLKPLVGKEYPAEKIAEAHAFLESRQSTGKIVLHW